MIFFRERHVTLFLDYYFYGNSTYYSLSKADLFPHSFKAFSHNTSYPLWFGHTSNFFFFFYSGSTFIHLTISYRVRNFEYSAKKYSKVLDTWHSFWKTTYLVFLFIWLGRRRDWQSWVPHRSKGIKNKFYPFGCTSCLLHPYNIEKQYYHCFPTLS